MTRLRAVIGVAALVTAACGGGGGEAKKVAIGETTGIGIELSAPTGWFTSDDGLTIAQRESDLTAERPGGARVQAAKAKASTETLADLVAEESAEHTEVIDGPEEVTVDGRKGVGLTLRESEPETDSVRQKRYLAVVGPKGVGVLIVMDAPPDTFGAQLAAMTTAIAWAD